MTSLKYLMLGLSLFAAAPARAETSLASGEACEDLGDQLIEWAAYQAVVSQYYSHYAYYDVDRMLLAPSVDGAPARAETKTGEVSASGPSNYTKTNVQEAGVDEADVIKTDGKHIYTIHGRHLLILKSWPVDDTTIIGKLELPANSTPTQLFLRGDKLVILSYVQDQLEMTGQRPWFYGTRISVVDIRDRERPTFDRHLDIEGSLAESRMVGNDLYVVSNGNMSVPAGLLQAANRKVQELGLNGRFVDDWQVEQQRAQRLVANHLRDEFSQIDFEDSMPRTRRSFFRGPMSSLRPMYSCNDIFVPKTSGAQLGILNLTHLDLDRAWDADHTGLFASGWTIYSSTDALYAAMPDYGWGWAWGWWTNEQSEVTSHIHKFALRGKNGKPSYAGSGKVRGTLLNQFSMSEHQGDLRVVTTDQSNNLFVLRERRGRLAVIGSIEGLAPGERIFSARMFGDKGYLVTFRQTDPLFTLDLSDPRSPRVAGELKINGYSSYIHPLDADHLLTIGQDADDNGRVQGMHIQIFDVSDPASPKRGHQHRLSFPGGYSWSAAEWDHHAFTYDAASKTLALPLQIYGQTNGAENFSGLVMFSVDANRGFRELGRITHARMAARHDYDVYSAFAYGAITRSIIMDDFVFTLSHLGLQVNELRDPKAEISSVLFSEEALSHRYIQ